MLEESLTNPKNSPADAALAVLFFLRQELPLGGAAAEARFIRLFPMLMERIFGSLLQRPLDAKDSLLDKDVIQPFHHQGGGWLNRDRWLMRSTSSTRTSSNMDTPSSSSSSQQGPHDIDPIVELLSGLCIPLNPQAHGSSTRSTECTSPNLVDILEEFMQRKHVVHAGLPLGTLPHLTQINLFSLLLSPPANVPPIDPKTTMLDHSSYTFYASSLSQALMDFQRNNAKELFMHLFCVGPQDQKEILHSLKKWVLQWGVGSSSSTSTTTMLHPRPFASPSAIPPTITPQGGGSNRVTVTPNKEAPSMNLIQSMNILFNMLEYYLILFIRFPLASPPAGTVPPPSKDESASKTSTQGSIGSTTITGNRHFTLEVPRANVYESTTSSLSYGSRQPYGEAIYYECFKAYLNRYIKHEYKDSHSSTVMEYKPIDRKTELFLRIIMELWLDREYVFNPTTTTTTTVDCASTLTTGRTDETFGMDTSFIHSMLSSKDFPLPLPTPKGFQFGRFTPLPSSVQKCLYSLVQHVVSDPCITYIYCDLLKSSKPQIHSILQPSLYNYIRLALRYAPVHDPNSSFYSALKLWLLWMEPWNVTHRKRTPANDFLHTMSDRVSTAGRSSHHPSSMHSVMDIPKASDPSKYSSTWKRYVTDNLHFYTVPLAIVLRRAREFDFSARDFDRSVDYLRKVFRVFSPQLLSCGMDLKACQNDMQVLLEEIVISHNRNIGDEDFLDQIGKWFGLIDRKPSHLLEKFIEQGKSIVGFPLDYEVIPSKKKDTPNNINETLALSPERASDTLLTDTGRKQVACGARLCSKSIVSLGDPMYYRPRCYEIPLLVQLTIKLSEKLNNYLGLCKYSEDTNNADARDGKSSLARMIKQRNEYREVMFRFNLRFLADYRNCLFIVFISLLIKLLYR